MMVRIAAPLTTRAIETPKGGPINKEFLQTSYRLYISERNVTLKWKWSAVGLARIAPRPQNLWVGEQ
jgi:hypothetical protein